jgi:uncharacterized protein YegJ (DUF2314 family)
MTQRCKSCLSIVLTTAVAGHWGCGKPEYKYSPEGTTAKGSADDPVYRFDDDDADMNAAIKEAKASLSTFVAALKRPAPAQSYFAVKKPYPVRDGGDEHIWISNVSLDGSNFRGTVDNDPAGKVDVKIGDTVTVAPHEISDWMIIDDGRLIGGYTIRVFRDRLPPGERAEFDREMGLRFE